jgi:NAD(P)-dependent dehydrogenase (short-subunit alcohol dehydrogenase family)
LNIVDTEQSRSAAEEVGRQHSTIDILVNNAGVFKGKAFSALVPEDFDWMMTATFKGAFFTALYAQPHLLNGAVLSLLAARWSIPSQARAIPLCGQQVGLTGIHQRLRAGFERKGQSSIHCTS